MSIASLITSSPTPAPYPLDTMESAGASLQANLTGSSAGGQNIDAISTDFEAVFLTQMMQEMFSGEATSSYFGGGTAGDVYKGYLLNEYGKLMAQTGGIGIGAQVKQELLKLQEASQ